MRYLVVDPDDYAWLIDHLKKDNICLEDRRALAGKSFSMTAYYDASIARYFSGENKIPDSRYLTLPFRRETSLRYGENPHQEAVLYRESSPPSASLLTGRQLHGKELSYNNINDGDAAIDLLMEFEDPAVVAVKHANPCGVGSGQTLMDAWDKAYACDTESIYGGIVALNREVSEVLAKAMNWIFLELVIAPSFTEKALAVLKQKKNIRLITLPALAETTKQDRPLTLNYKRVEGGLLVQEKDQILMLENLKVVSKREVSPEELSDLLFAWRIVKHEKSNAVIIARNEASLGFGTGSVNRFWSVENAIKQAGEKAKGAVLASDGFFPFTDSITSSAHAGVTAIIQPGGSIRDEEVIDAADRLGLSMVFTGTRHFKH